jgi:hypothetical protein
VALQQKTNLSIREVWDLPTGKAKGRGHESTGLTMGDLVFWFVKLPDLDDV